MNTRPNVDWQLPDPLTSSDQAQLAVLMDIRRELRSLNLRLGRLDFLRIPSRLQEVARNTRKKPKRKRGR